MYEWAKEMNCAVTVCDTKGIILYMNDKACQTFAKYGNLIGKNLLTCHNAQSQEKIHEMLQTGGSNAYTIEKNGIKKMIYQTAWFNEGIVGGLVEISMELPRRNASLYPEINAPPREIASFLKPAASKVEDATGN